MNADDAYAVLGVLPGADRRAVEAAYARLLAQHPADRAPQEFARILAAYEAVKQVAPEAREAAPAPAPLPDDAAALQARFEAMFEEKRFGELWTELSSARFVESTRGDPARATVALRAIGALVWHVPAAIHHIQPFASLPAEYGLGPLIQHVQMEAAIATRWNAAMSRGALWDGSVLPETLVNLVGEPLLASPARRRQTFAEVVELLAEPSRFLAALDRLAAVDPELVKLVIQRLRGESPLWGPSALAPLSDDTRAQLGARLGEIARRSVTRYFITPLLVVLGIIGGIGGLVLAVMVAPDFAGHGLTFGMIPAGIVLSIRDKLAKNEWNRWARYDVAAIVSQLGLQSDVISAWLRQSPRVAKRLKVHIFAIENDLGLMLLGAVAAVAQEHVRLARPG